MGRNTSCNEIPVDSCFFSLMYSRVGWDKGGGIMDSFVVLGGCAAIESGWNVIGFV